VSSALSLSEAKSGVRPSLVDAFLLNPQSHSHAVQFYDQKGSLFETVATFLAAGLDAGDPLLVIATQAHCDAFMERLDPARVAAAIASGQLKLLDASETLATFMIGDMPDPELFREMVWRALSDLQHSYSGARVRAYGEMVDLLWSSGNSRAAIRLEELWNGACETNAFSLLCAYAMGHFYREGDRAQFVDLCRAHSHVIPTELLADFGDDESRLREITLLQQRAVVLETEIQHRKELEQALRDALRERARVEEDLRASVQREREARAQAEASDAFKQVFLAMLGHDLRNPLNTILTTARMMTIRRELPPESQKRLERVISSGDRMRRMIEQILDVTRAKLSAGIPIEPHDEADLTPRVLKIVEEIRLAHPQRDIEFSPAQPCPAQVDGDRFEQVICNLLANAVAHGDPERPITVALQSRANQTRLCVHNHGTPIEPAFMPLLFDPFRRGGSPQGRSDGLGLGLYISQCIVHAHGGQINVESTAEAGTTFEVIVPRA
jgi:signal transduction histidine kinase